LRMEGLRPQRAAAYDGVGNRLSCCDALAEERLVAVIGLASNIGVYTWA